MYSFRFLHHQFLIFCGVLGLAFLNGSCIVKFAEKPNNCYQADGTPLLENSDFFTEAVFPLLKEKCSGCHGAFGLPESPQLKLSSALEAYKSLTNLRSFVDSTKKLVVPGKVLESYLIDKVSLEKPASGVRMPIGTALSTSEINLLKKWIEQGAPSPGVYSTALPKKECRSCDQNLALDGNSSCHPCKGKNPPEYCVDKNFFRDSLMIALVTKCSSCHGSNAPANSLILDTTQFDGDSSSIADRFRRIYDNMVGVTTYNRPSLPPTKRIDPSNLNNSLLYQSVFYSASQVDSIKNDNSPDSLQYKLSVRMPPNASLVDSTLLKNLRRWILSGAPGPGDLTAAAALSTQWQKRQKEIFDSIQNLSAAPIQGNQLKPPVKRKR